MVENDTQGFAKTCYYEILDVDRKAETKAIEKVREFLPSKGFNNNILLLGIQKSCTQMASR